MADALVGMYAAMGLSTQAIAKRTGFTVSQVTYRLGFMRIKRKDYRSGESEFCRLVEEKLGSTIERRVVIRLRQAGYGLNDAGRLIPPDIQI